MSQVNNFKYGALISFLTERLLYAPIMLYIMHGVSIESVGIVEAGFSLFVITALLIKLNKGKIQ